ncbi:MAG: methyltransferase domain-containing protein [Actinomycetota bacterium]|nr:methyltransferase domain-containing protein [Actinomycetota bacterium]
MLTVDLRRLRAAAGDLVLDLGCGGGRHAFAASRARAHVVALDSDATEAAGTAAMLGAMRVAGEADSASLAAAVRGDALALPFPDSTFDRVIAAEVLEHLPDDGTAVAELARVLRPGGTLAVSVPRWWPEQVCWALADDYHAPAAVGGHVRIYRAGQLAARLRRAGLRILGSHHAHALHSPYWWLKCAVGLHRDQALPVRAYHRFLVWDISTAARPVRLLERALNPLIGKSLVVYGEKPRAA